MHQKQLCRINLHLFWYSFLLPEPSFIPSPPSFLPCTSLLCGDGAFSLLASLLPLVIGSHRLTPLCRVGSWSLCAATRLPYAVVILPVYLLAILRLELGQAVLRLAVSCLTGCLCTPTIFGI